MASGALRRFELGCADVTLSTQLFSKMSLGDTYLTHPCIVEECLAWCGIKVEDGPTWMGPLTWNGSAFSLVSPTGQELRGVLSQDRPTVLEFRYLIGDFLFFHWINLPLDPARTTSDISVFAVSGPAAADHVVEQNILYCDDKHSNGIDDTKIVQLEAWLAR